MTQHIPESELALFLYGDREDGGQSPGHDLTGANREALAATALPLASLAKRRPALDVALQVSAFIEQAGIDADAPETLEGLLLAMQMIGGPQRAADTVRYCAIRRD